MWNRVFLLAGATSGNSGKSILALPQYKRVIIPDGIKKIGDQAFLGCWELEEITSNKGAVLVYISLCEGMQSPIVIQTQPGIQKERIQSLALCFGMACCGVSEMQMTMGALYWHGTYLPKSYEESVRWSRYAANQGDPNAMLDLAECYLYGIGVEQDIEKGTLLMQVFNKLENQ